MGTKITKYVSMLMFSADGKKVAVLTKNRPAFLAGRLCPVGGHIELDEAPVFAAVREFHEETGVSTEPDVWQSYATCVGAEWKMHCFVAFDDAVLDCRSTTDEPVEVRDTAELLAAVVSDPAMASHDLIALIGLALQSRYRLDRAGVQMFYA